jgi:transposase
MCWHRIRSERKKRQIRRTLGSLRQRSVALVEDETDLLQFPPLRAMWSPRGMPARVMLSGTNARRVVFGCMNLKTGHRLFHACRRQRAEDFQAFLRQVRRHYRGWRVVMVLDSDSSHTAKTSQALARRLGIRLLWLPKRAPELNPLESLWGQGKNTVSANRQYGAIDEQVASFLAYVSGLSNAAARQASGVLSESFWLRHAVSKHFCKPA